MSDHHDHGDWFRHSADEALPQQEHASHVNTTAIGLTLLAIVFGVLFTVVVLSMYFVQYANTRKAEMNEGVGSAETYIAYRDQSAAQLQALEWVDRAAGTVNVPVDAAMDAVLAEYNAPGIAAVAPWVNPKAAVATAGSADPHGERAALDPNTDPITDPAAEVAPTDG
jgi:hypothetical protein